MLFPMTMPRPSLSQAATQKNFPPGREKTYVSRVGLTRTSPKALVHVDHIAGRDREQQYYITLQKEAGHGS